MTPEARDFRRLQRIAEEIIVQCDHYARNVAAGRDDSMRAEIAAFYASLAQAVGQRMRRRFLRVRAKRGKP